MECLGLKQVKPSYTPADLFSASRKCVDNADYHKAAQLYLTARIYAYYDTRRVADISAHQAATALVTTVYGGLPQDELARFSKATDHIAKGDPSELQAFCSAIRVIGKPDYHPGYMIQHGMGAFMGKERENGGLVKDFNPDAAWSSVLQGFCGLSP